VRVFSRLRQAALGAAVLGLAGTVGTAAAAAPNEARSKTDISPILVVGEVEKNQHGGDAGHLPARKENWEVVSKLKLSGVTPESIADVAYHKGFAYLNSWNEPTCRRGGTFIVDMRDPAAPKEIGFVPAPFGTIHGEGAHVVSYKGRDILAVNNEPCTYADTPDEVGPGGFDLIDVTDPYNAVKLGAPGQPTGGDTGPDNGSLVGTQVPHSNHSTVMWEFAGRLYLMTVDNLELHDVDIHDISDPANPQPVAEYDLLDNFPQIEDSGNIGSFAGTFHHDSKIKLIDGKVIVNTSYWDGGYVTYDLSDPLAPKYIGDTSFDEPEPLIPALNALEAFPEGNAHYADFSRDNKYILAADEDFTTHRGGTFSVAGKPYPSTGIGGGATPASLPDRTMNGPTVYGGYACDDSKPVPLRSAYNFNLEAGEDAILVVQRGPTGDTNNPEEACFPGEKGKNAYVAGWRTVLYINRHLGPGAEDTAACGSGDFRAGQIPVVACTTHGAGHDIFSAPGTAPFPVPYDDEAEMPVGTVGKKVSATSQFDGWGYAHLFKMESGVQTRIDSYAVEESLDERYSVGFGDLSIHEHAPDPLADMTYIAYYAAGARAITYSDQGITETGAYIDQGGNNFWGVEYVGESADNKPLLAFSDRDYGLYVMKYTGPRPGYVAPAPQPSPPSPPAKDMTDPVVSLLSNGRQRVSTLRGTNGLAFRIRVNEASKLDVKLKARMRNSKGKLGKVQTFKTSKGINVSAGQTVTVRLKLSASLRRKLRGQKNLPGFLTVKAVDAAGNDTTRTKRLSFR
jgi:hypothetical protein